MPLPTNLYKKGGIFLPSNPINVFPNSNTIDVKGSEDFSFTFTGSELNSYFLYICSAGFTTPLYTASVTLDTTAYNGEEIVFPLTSNNALMNGSDINYTWGMIFNPTPDSNYQEPMKDPNSTYNYFFYARTNPVLTPTIANATVSGDVYIVNDRNLNISYEYTQSQGIKVKYFSFDLYNGTSEQDIKPVNLLDSTGKVFSSNIVYNYGGLIEDNRYIVVFNLDTQSDQTYNQIFYISANYDPVELTGLNLELNYNDQINAFELSWSKGAFSAPTEEGEITYPTNSFVDIGEDSSLFYNKLSGKDISVDDPNNFGFSIKFRINESTTDIAWFGLITTTEQESSYNPIIINFDGSIVKIQYNHAIIASLEVNTAFALQNYNTPLSDVVYMWYSDSIHNWTYSSSDYWLVNEGSYEFSADFIAIINMINGAPSAELYQILSNPEILSVTGNIATVFVPYGATGYVAYADDYELGEGAV